MKLAAQAKIYKHYRDGTERTTAPSKTLAKLQSHLPGLGITRLANITGLDVLDIPVVMACRPLSRSLAVSQGKGLDLTAAKVSAIMESIESHHAERININLRYASYNDLVGSARTVNVERLPQSAQQRFLPERELLWVEASEYVSGEPIWVPYELVSTNYTLPLVPGSGCFPANTNGLAAGNHILEAISHGCCELIERDSTTLWRLHGDTALLTTGLNPHSIRDPACRRLLEKYERAQIDVCIWDTSTDLGIPSFIGLAVDRLSARCDPEFGAGCHPNPAIALARTLTEIAQSRATFIAGSRDDFTLTDYQADVRAERRRECQRWFDLHQPRRDFRRLRNHTGATINSDLQWILESLQKIGLDQLIVVDLTQKKYQIPVVKMVIPGLEGAYEGVGSDYVPGVRAQRVLA